MVVLVGEAVGQQELGLESDDPLDQAKVIPPDAVRVVDEPVHILALGPVRAGGPGFLVTNTESTEVHPVRESVIVK
jgi:hypothetical protein